MYKAVSRAIRITFSPDSQWQAIKEEAADQREILSSFLLPLALIPAVAWSIGLLLFGGSTFVEPGLVAHRGLMTYIGSVFSVLLLAVAMYMLAPLFGVKRVWRRAFQVAVYSSSPVLLAGLLLVMPDLAFATILAIFHSFYLQYGGVRTVLGAKEGDAAEYVALGAVALIAVSTIVGALGSAAGVL